MGKQRIADYIADFLAVRGFDTVFTVVGGGAMHLNDAFGASKHLKDIHHHHEQAAAMAAEGYARIKGKPAVVCVTSGPGGTNAITGVLGAYQDSIPMLILSGQVRYPLTVEASGLRLRHFGEQEHDIVRTVRPLTKHVEMVRRPEDILYALEKALYIMEEGRKGPVWLDIPLDVQGAEIEVGNLRHFTPPKPLRQDHLALAELVLTKLRTAKTPLLLAGSSIRLSDSYASFCRVVQALGIPVLATTCTADLFETAHPLYFGNFGILGGRAGNFLVQNADVIVSLGCRFALNQIGFCHEAFAPQSYKIAIDIDAEELKKETMRPDLPIHADLKDILPALEICLKDAPMPEKPAWMSYARHLREAFPILAQAKDRTGVNPYLFADRLMSVLPADGIVVVGSNLGGEMAIETGIRKGGQRLFCNKNCGSMGYGLPAAIGAAIAAGRPVFSLDGDGSIQMNLQELQTIVYNRLPIKIVVYNNGGYASIVRTQRGFFHGRLTGCTKESGLDCPDFSKIAAAFDIPYFSIRTNSETDSVLTMLLQAEGCALCEIFEDPEQGLAFKTTSKKLSDGSIVSAPIDELAPPLPPEEFERYRLFREEEYL